eukprot:gene2191-2854_t
MTPSAHRPAPLPTPTGPTASSVRLLRASLVAVWLGTAVVSAITHRTQGDALLRQAGLSDDLWIQALIWGGAAADLAMGIALWRPGCPGADGRDDRHRHRAAAPPVARPARLAAQEPADCRHLGGAGDTA